MLLSIAAVPVTKVITQRLPTLKKLRTILKMKSLTPFSLMTMAESFRSLYQLPNGVSQRGIQKALIDEEWSEFHEAFHHQTDEEQLKELADLVYVSAQYCASQEWDLDEALRRVHHSNGTKVGDDGKPIRRPDGKILKGPNYQPPTLTDLVKK